ncbi:unnamed protein product, partial [Ixodes persulcatus]
TNKASLARFLQKDKDSSGFPPTDKPSQCHAVAHFQLCAITRKSREAGTLLSSRTAYPGSLSPVIQDRATKCFEKSFLGHIVRASIGATSSSPQVCPSAKDRFHRFAKIRLRSPSTSPS